MNEGKVAIVILALSCLASIAALAAAPQQLISPANGATNCGIPLYLVWSDTTSAPTWRVQVSTTGDMATIVVDSSGVIADTSNYSRQVLAYSTVYFWRIGTTDARGVFAWSPIWSFTTMADTLPLPAGPVLISPLASAFVSFAFVWNATSNATSYVLQVSMDQNFATLLVNQTVVGTSYLWTGSDYHTQYYWRVCATNRRGSGPWSTAICMTARRLMFRIK